MPEIDPGLGMALFYSDLPAYRATRTILPALLDGHRYGESYSAETRGVVDKLLLERLSLAGIVRVTGVSMLWLQYYVNKTYQAQARRVNIPPQKTPINDSM